MAVTDASFFIFSFLQYINKTGFRVCFKELFAARYDPLFITYTVLSGTSLIILLCTGEDTSTATIK